MKNALISVIRLFNKAVPNLDAEERKKEVKDLMKTGGPFRVYVDRNLPFKSWYIVRGPCTKAERAIFDMTSTDNAASGFEPTTVEPRVQ